MDYLPKYYAEVREMNEIMDTGGQELGELEAALEGTLNQFFVDTATWGLAQWEKEFDIPQDNSKPVNERRSVIKSKLRGTGTVTVELIQSVAQSYDRGLVEVVDTPGRYAIEINFVDTVGLPPNLDDLKAAIEEIKPAHLAMSFHFRYLMVAEVDAFTIDQIDNVTLDKFAWG